MIAQSMHLGCSVCTQIVGCIQIIQYLVSRCIQYDASRLFSIYSDFIPNCMSRIKPSYTFTHQGGACVCCKYNPSPCLPCFFLSLEPILTQTNQLYPSSSALWSNFPCFGCFSGLLSNAACACFAQTPTPSFPHVPAQINPPPFLVFQPKSSLSSCFCPNPATYLTFVCTQHSASTSSL